ncbi:protein DpdF [Paenibacillus algorifonticola]|uniref:protein DpdF n=1 Tax=Paenibacillus algorifonticola TaxID=684063 RepID=UPI003D26E8F3
MNEYDEFVQLIETSHSTEDFITSFYVRFKNSMHSRRTSPRDKVSLIRSILRHNAEKQGGISSILWVPRNSEWPDPHMWEESGIAVIVQKSDRLLIKAQPWIPKWLPDSSITDIEKPLYAEIPRQTNQIVKGDPFLLKMKLSTYRSQGQADAIRSIMTAPEGSTLVVNLPTGTGKSLCAHLPSIMASEIEGVSIVVVPTVALAIDQERAMAPFISHSTAYFSGREAENERIRSRICDGTQRIVFTSPEAIMQSLFMPLQLAAGRGYFRYLFIDEAHMIDLWGDEFRPAFQELAGWRKHLMREAPALRTVLLSATITEVSLDAMEDLFGTPGPFEHCSAVQLRPEPAYWFKRANNMQDKRRFILDAVFHLPRPLILYTSEVKDAEEWGATLRAEGYGRLEVVTGKTPNRKREAIVSAWRNRDIDIVVATSAFGLGVDQPDVRAVIHACVPESLDRYYQEVGRGGRDGSAAMSLVVYTDEDIRIAKEMSGKMLITIERGRQRWRAMFQQKQIDIRYPDCYLVPIDVSPSLDSRDIDMGGSARNAAWNIRTLNLMSRSKLIEMDWQKWDESYSKAEYNGNTHRLVRILHNDHLQEVAWKTLVEPFRLVSSMASETSLVLMKELLQGKRCAAEIFKIMYHIPERLGVDRRKAIGVQTSCGGCPNCRREAQDPYANMAVSRLIQWQKRPGLTEQLSRRLDNKENAVLFFDQWPERRFSRLSGRERERWSMLLRYLIDHGVRQLCAEEAFLNEINLSQFHLESEPLFTNNIDTPFYRWLHVPTVVIHPCTDSTLHAIERMLQQNLHPFPIITLLPEYLEESKAPNRLLIDVLQSKKYRLTEFLLEVGL